jgi:DNA-3-methyladenine glycosylase II
MHRLSLHTTIAPVTPYRLDLTAQALRRVSSNVVDVFTAEGTYLRAFSGDDGVNIIEVQQQTDGALDVRITGRGAHERVETVTTMLGTGVDLRRWYRRAARFPWLATLARELRGVKPPRYPDLWEALCNGIVFQQLSISAASTIMRRLVERFSEPQEHRGVRLCAFPAPERIVQSKDHDLQRLGLSRQKAAYLKSAAAEAKSLMLISARIQSLPTSEALVELQKFNGIGQWSAANILLRGFGRLDVFPLGDSGAAQNIKLLSNDPQINLNEVLLSLGDMRGMLYFHLLLGKLRRPAASSATEVAH